MTGQRHPIRWIGKRPSKNFAQIPNELCRERITSKARSVALYLWSQRDGWELSPTAIHNDLGIDRKTVGEALDELSAHRWLAIRVTGARSREYYAHPARRLTEVEHAHLTQQGRENLPLADQAARGESPETKGRNSHQEAQAKP